MPVTGLDHVNIRTMNVAASADFYARALGLEYHAGPVVMGHQGHWLHDSAGKPIIHFRVMEAGSDSTGPLDHVALSCQGKAATLARLREAGVEFSSVEDLLPGITQVFLRDPHGVPIELQITGV